MRLLKLVPDNTRFRFVRLRWIAFTLTFLLTVASITLVATRGLNLGVDFVGGLMIEASFEKPVPLDDLRRKMSGMNVGDVSLQQFGNANTVAIRMPLPPGNDEAVQKVVKNVQAEISNAYPDVNFRRVETVSGKVSGELITDGILAVAFAMLGITIYTWVRFEWHFGVSTLVGLIHDVTVALGFFALMQWEFDLNIVAAMLTIVGYSINDKIVIDDRIRENLRKYRQMNMKDLVDLSVNETLPRTVMTSLTLVLALGALLLLGGEVIRGFTAAMLIGIIVGTYSSIYVSSSLLISLGVGPHTFLPKDDSGAERITKKV